MRDKLIQEKNNDKDDFQWLLYMYVSLTHNYYKMYVITRSSLFPWISPLEKIKQKNKMGIIDNDLKINKNNG